MTERRSAAGHLARPVRLRPGRAGAGGDGGDPEAGRQGTGPARRAAGHGEGGRSVRGRPGPPAAGAPPAVRLAVAGRPNQAPDAASARAGPGRGGPRSAERRSDGPGGIEAGADLVRRDLADTAGSGRRAPQLPSVGAAEAGFRAADDVGPGPGRLPARRPTGRPGHPRLRLLGRFAGRAPPGRTLRRGAGRGRGLRERPPGPADHPHSRPPAAGALTAAAMEQARAATAADLPTLATLWAAARRRDRRPTGGRAAGGQRHHLRGAGERPREPRWPTPTDWSCWAPWTASRSDSPRPGISAGEPAAGRRRVDLRRAGGPAGRGRRGDGRRHAGLVCGARLPRGGRPGPAGQPAGQGVLRGARVRGPAAGHASAAARLPRRSSDRWTERRPELCVGAVARRAGPASC